ncbi:hypothetical protein MLD38_032030 [Melastoma candidum]|uniref:Uncharacterized protein n=1 Tax=Melastoma candidum TaxID=119954 RepID=A0ACB9MRJ1_9MYRT|nr:hypothetical protein MLD38_032030 [Melastoma candidum]
MQRYLNNMKALSAVGEPVKHQDYLWYLLEGLPAEYDAVVTSVYSRPDQPALEEVYNLLLNFELRLERRQTVDCIIPQPQEGLLGRPPTVSNPYPRWPNIPSSTRPKPRCQICFKIGHTATTCYHRLQYEFQPQPQTHFTNYTPYPAHFPPSQYYYPQPTYLPLPTQPIPTHTLLAVSKNPVPETWLVDSGATHHVAPTTEGFQNVASYQGISSVVVGNGHHVRVSHVGNKSLDTPSGMLHLQQILHIPTLSQRLVSVSKLCQDNAVNVEFTCDSFFVKDKTTNQILLKGLVDQGLYKLPSHIVPDQLPSYFSPPGSSFTKFNNQLFRHLPQTLVATSTAKLSSVDNTQWHMRLGHPCSEVLAKVLDSFLHFLLPKEKVSSLLKEKENL